MSTSYADSAQGRALDDRMEGRTLGGAQDNWDDDGYEIFSRQCNEREARRLAGLPDRLRIAMGQMEAVLAKQGGLK